MVGDVINRTADSTVTIEWTLPSDGSIINYTISVLPTPLSTDTNSQTFITITVLYNTNYHVNLLDPVCGGQATTNFTLGKYKGQRDHVVDFGTI